MINISSYDCRTYRVLTNPWYFPPSSSPSKGISISHLQILSSFSYSIFLLHQKSIFPSPNILLFSFPDFLLTLSPHMSLLPSHLGCNFQYLPLWKKNGNTQPWVRMNWKIRLPRTRDFAPLGPRGAKSLLPQMSRFMGAYFLIHPSSGQCIITFFFIERECIEFEFIYCHYSPAVWRVISNTLPLIPHICHFLTQAKFLENKIYTEIYTVNCQFTQ